MSKRGGFVGLINQIARSAAKVERERQMLERERQREFERHQRELMKRNIQLDKEAKQKYLEARLQEVAELNSNITQRISEVKTVLEQALQKDNVIHIDSLRIRETYPEFELPKEIKSEPVLISEEEYFSSIPQPTILDKLIPGWEKRYKNMLEEGKKNYQDYRNKFAIYVRERETEIEKLTDEYNRKKNKFRYKSKTA